MKAVHLAFINRILQPVARYAIRHGLHIQEIVECLKVALVQASSAQLEQKKEKSTTSRLSIMTGIHRKDIDRLLEPLAPYQGDEDRLVRLVGLWQSAKQYTDSKRRPIKLSFGFVGSDFHKLVEKVSRELNPATVLFELERTGVVQKTPKGLALIRTAYAPNDKLEYGLKSLADDCTDLLEAVDENLRQENSIPNHHARTCFDKVREENAEMLRSWLVKEGHELHKRARNFLAELDQDVSPVPSFKGRVVRVTIGSFSRISKE